MPIAKLPNVELFYEIHGQGEPVLLIHGLGVDSSCYLGLIRHLKSHFQLIRCDLRGSGQTQFDGKVFDLHDFAQDIAGLMDFLNIRQAHLVGHSMGGMIARYFAANFTSRVKKLVVLNSRSQKNWVTIRYWEGLAAVRHRHDLLPHEVASLIMPLAYSSGFLADETKVNNLLAAVKQYPYPQSLENFSLQTQAMRSFDAMAYIAQLNMPVLLVGGSRDIFVPIEEMRDYAKKLTNATLVEQEGGAHNPLIETPEWLAKEIFGFLTRKAYADNTN